ncbi:MAG: hypothetical protein ACYSTL_01225, partial [Planctomycetota bacterium]
MVRDRLKRIAILVALSVFALIGAGCSQEIPIRQYPRFYTSELKTVAVAPFYSQMFRDRPGQIFADRLAAGLAANGTYKIVNPADLPAPSAHRRDDAGETESIVELLNYLKKRGDVQGVIVGSIEAYQGATYMTHYPSYRYGYYRPYYRHYPYYGGYWYHDYSDYVYSVRNEATVAIYSRIIRVADGETLAATPGLVSMTMHSYGYPAQEKTLQLLDRSTDAVVEQLLELFAIV